ncbi:uncharacterized protein RCO7_04030 [Rhynchosporium graminicola]|uniref:Uncharacterized protein n=1 Tax=Rhynchosporium graminicola TaxID=2792576 RepID=A0A1E1LS09_9HELO|nr:uncharacterized protein RCO7_04030 [Rhynchosporium commune]
MSKYGKPSAVVLKAHWRIEDWPVGSKEANVQISQNPNEIASTTERSPGHNDPSTSHIRSPKLITDDKEYGSYTEDDEEFLALAARMDRGG